jgi:hypothetical protein
MFRWLKRQPRKQEIEDELNYHLDMLARECLEGAAVGTKPRSWPSECSETRDSSKSLCAKSGRGHHSNK